MEKPKKLENKCIIPTIGMLPTSYLMSLTYEEQLLWLLNYLEKTVIPTLNQNGELTEQVMIEFEKLKNYINSYFDDLDVQEEINNKLDEMGESGQLTDIIAQYLQLAGILAFNTKNDMKNADNLINGSFTKTYGNNTYNDGKGRFYKIRTITSSDVVDEVNIIALSNYPTLIAELMPDNIVGNLNDLETANKNTTVEAINEIVNIIGSLNNLKTQDKSSIVNSINSLIHDKLVIFGDSWSDDDVSDVRWPAQVSDILNLTKHNYAENGAWFTENSNSVSTQVTSFINSDIDKNKVKYIVLCGGLNDYRNNITSQVLANTIQSYYNTLKNACPNAKIVYINNFQYPYSKSQSLYWIQVNNYLSSTGIISMNLDGMIGKPLFNTSNYFHLTPAGQLLYGTNILACLTGGQQQGYRDIRVFEDSEAIVTYQSERYDNMILCTLNVKPKTTFFTKTISVNDVNLSYDTGTTTLGMIGRSYTPCVANVNTNQIVLATKNDGVGFYENNEYIFSYIQNIE